MRDWSRITFSKRNIFQQVRDRSVATNPSNTRTKSFPFQRASWCSRARTGSVRREQLHAQRLAPCFVLTKHWFPVLRGARPQQLRQTFDFNACDVTPGTVPAKAQADSSFAVFASLREQPLTRLHAQSVSDPDLFPPDEAPHASRAPYRLHRTQCT